MEYIFGMLILLSVILVACSTQNDSTRILEELLSDEEGQYRFLVVHPEGDGLKNPTFMREFDNIGQVMTGGTHMFLENAQKTYPTLEIKEAPYFIFFNTKNIEFGTDKESDASSFIKEKLKPNNNKIYYRRTVEKLKIFKAIAE